VVVAVHRLSLTLGRVREFKFRCCAMLALLLVDSRVMQVQCAIPACRGCNERSGASL